MTARFSVPLDQLVLIRSFGDTGASWRCQVGANAIPHEDYDRAGCRYDHNADTHDQAAADATEHIRRWHAATPHPYDDAEPVHLELYGVSGHTDALANSLEGEARWLVDHAGRNLREAADIVERSGVDTRTEARP